MAEPFYSYTQKEEFEILDRVKMLLVTKYYSNKTIIQLWFLKLAILKSRFLQ